MRPTIRGMLYAACAALLLTVPTPVAAQFDPAFNHLKCYQIKGPRITGKLLLENQFGREIVATLQPVLLCAPTKKTCCDPAATVAGCQPTPCNPDPVQPTAAVHHFKCYKLKVRECTDPNDTACATVGKFPKGIVVNLLDQFHEELNVTVGKPRLLCAPVLKQRVGQTTTTTTVTTTTTTTTTMMMKPPCDQSTPVACDGFCPDALGSQCMGAGPGQCQCVTITPSTPPCGQGNGAPECWGFCPQPQVCVVGGPAGCVCQD